MLRCAQHDNLFQVFNYHFININSSNAVPTLRNPGFREWFGHVEAAAARLGKALKDMTLEELDALREEAKRG